MVKARRARHRTAFAPLLLAALVVGAPTPTRAAVFNPQTFTLQNGMRVVVIPNHRVPVVTHMVWYKVGAADDPSGRSGLAHLLEHLMFKGTRKFPAGEFSKTVARQGGQENAFTSYDFTAFFQNIAKDRLPTVMEMEADRMTNLVLTKEQVETECEVVIEERRQRIDNDPSAVLSEHADAVFHLNHPYRRPAIGWEHELRTLTLDDALAFYKRWYAPNNAVLIVAGDATVEELRPLAEKHYGSIPAAATPAHDALADPPQQTERRVVLWDERVRQPSWSRSFPAPSHLTEGNEHAYALQVLAQILGEDPTSRLYRKIVVDSELATSAGAWYDPSKRGPSKFTLYASPRPGVGLPVLEDAVAEATRKLVADGVTVDEVERAKERMVADAVYARDSLSTGARMLGEALAIGLSIDDVESWPDRVRAVTKEQVDAAARVVLDNNRSVAALLMGADGSDRAAAR